RPGSTASLKHQGVNHLTAKPKSHTSTAHSALGSCLPSQRTRSSVGGGQTPSLRSASGSTQPSLASEPGDRARRTHPEPSEATLGVSIRCAPPLRPRPFGPTSRREGAVHLR